MEDTFSPIEIHLLRRMLRREFDECPWYDADQVMELAEKLGQKDLLIEMEQDLNAELQSMLHQTRIRQRVA